MLYLKFVKFIKKQWVTTFGCVSMQIKLKILPEIIKWYLMSVDISFDGILIFLISVKIPSGIVELKSEVSYFLFY